MAVAPLFAAPIPIGPFLLNQAGQLSLGVPEAAPCFTFRWRSTFFTVRLSEDGVSLRAQAGRIPSTADGGGKRDGALTLLRALPPLLPADVHMRLLPDYRLQLDTECQPGWPATAASLFAPIVAMLFRLAPALDLLEEGGLKSG